MNENYEKLTDEQKEKLGRLKEIISGLGSLAIGFSGGVDSSFLVVEFKSGLQIDVEA